MKKKKILFLEARYDSFYGAQKSMLTLIQSLDRNRFHPKVVTTANGELRENYDKHNVPVDIIKLGKKANVFGGKLLEYSFFNKILVVLQVLLFNVKVFRYIKKNKIDIVYVNDLRALFYVALASKISRKKIVWYIRSDVNDSKATFLGFKFADKIVTIAHGVLRNIEQSKLQPYENKFTNIYTGFDFEQFKIIDKSVAKNQLGIESDKFVIGYLGSINNRKGIDLLVDAYLELVDEHSNIELMIVGSVSAGHETYWEEQKSKLEGYPFTYIPFTDKVSEAYSALDVFVLPSKSEGLPRVLIEAMAHKVPVISTDVGGVREIIVTDNHGLIVHDHANKKNMVCSLKKVVTKPNFRKEIVENGFYHVTFTFSKRQFREKINKLFETILD